MIRLGLDVTDLILTRTLSSNTFDLNKAINKLTTGLEINSAKDNAAAYSITNNLSTQISSMYVVQDNTLSGIDLLELAEAGLEQIRSQLKRLQILAIEAANETYDEVSRNAMQKEANNIIKQIELDIDDCRFEDVFEYSDVDLIEYYNMQIICYQKIADKIFDNFYKEKNTEAKKIFAKNIEVFRFHYDNLFLQSDLAKVVRAGTMYEVQSYTYVSLKVNELLQEYIKEIKQQCKDASD